MKKINEKKSIPDTLKSILWRFLWYFLAISFLNLIIYFNAIFNNPTVRQIGYFFQFKDKGLIDLNDFLYHLFVLKSFLPAIKYALVAIAVDFLLLQFLIPTAKNLKKNNSWKALLKFTASILQKMPLIVFLIAIAWEISASGAIGILNDKTVTTLGVEEQDYFAKNYVEPIEIQPPIKKRNLVTIYVESLESAYTNKKLFGDNLLASLTSISEDSNLNAFSFTDFRQLLNSEITIGGIVSTMCAIPFITPLFKDRNKANRGIKIFLPGATCVSDILAKHGYKNVFAAASSHDFGGKRLFSEEHSYTEIFDLNVWRKLKRYQNYSYTSWGIHDKDIMKEATTVLDRLQTEEEPFHLTLLTADTHGPTGFPSQACVEKYDRHFKNTLRCAAEEIRAFVDHASAKGHLENTDILILGDHLSRYTDGVTEIQNMPGDPLERNIFNLWISTNKHEKVTDEIVQYDIAPSVLEFIGFKIKNGRYGLGYSAFDSDSGRELDATADFQQRFEDLKNNADHISPGYLKMWVDHQGKTASSDR